jgi:raffinose/stachyose/melibiose transport system substrate-binding protein
MTMTLLAATAFAPVTALAQETTIKVWDEFGAEPMKGAMETIVGQCEEQVPGLSVDRTTMQMEQMQNILSTAIQSGEGPDVFYSSPGWSTVGPLIEAGAIADLTEAYDGRGWRDRVQPWAVDYVTYNDKIWALPYEAEIQGVFYHEDLFEEHGIEPPQTYDDFIAAAEKLKEAGFDAPIVTAARPAYVLGWLESSMLGATIPAEELATIVLGHNSWENTAYRNAVAKIDELNEKGFVPSGVLAYSYDDMMAQFYTKSSPMVLTGSWIVANIDGNFPDLEVGFFEVPPLEGVERRAPKASGGGFMLSANSENRDMALQFMDCLATAESAQTWLSEGLSRAPIEGVDPATADLSDLNRTVTDVVNQPLSAFNLYGILPAEVNNATWNGIQAMWAGQMTAEELVAAKQDAWQQAIEAGEVIEK